MLLFWMSSTSSLSMPIWPVLLECWPVRVENDVEKNVSGGKMLSEYFKLRGKSSLMRLRLAYASLEFSLTEAGAAMEVPYLARN